MRVAIRLPAGASMTSSEEAQIVIEPVTEAQDRVAREAYRDFGKGSGHPARLNFGDCFAYALAKVTGEALLFKGDDFAHTDIKPASN
jgi:ribonuclease VapC